MRWVEVKPTHDSMKARMLRLSGPGYSFCLRCGTPWNHTKIHDTKYSFWNDGVLEHRGCFPLCESCWTKLGHPEARIEYYATLISLWGEHHPVNPEQRLAIQKAVANGG